MEQTMSSDVSGGAGGVSRRDFLKTAGAAAATIPAIGVAAGIARGAYAGGGDTIKVGLVGCGGRGTGAATQALRADPGVVLWSMGDVFGERLDASHKALSDHFTDGRVQADASRRFIGFESYKQVIDSGVDVVVLTSYPNFRPEHIRYALDKGKHIFAEKPMAVDMAGLQSVMASGLAAKEKNLALCIGFCWRYHPAMREIMAQVLGGAIGEVTGVHTTYHAGTLRKVPRQPQWGDLEFQMRNWWHFTWISGDHIVEQAVHSVDRLAWAMGDRIPTKVDCLGGRAARSGPEHGDAYDHFSAIYHYENGVRAHHTCRQIDGCPFDNTDYIYGTKGRAVVNGWAPKTLKLYDYAGKELWAYKGEPEDMYQVEHNELFKSIREGRPINDLPKAGHSVAMAIGGRMAAYTGQTLTWEKLMESSEDLQPKSLAWDIAPPAPVVAIPGRKA
jgi:myo-inositol 2-dehydrogenase / D-chiro-inositol 1-dehydrogenase